jgi:hypothetical protein
VKDCIYSRLTRASIAIIGIMDTALSIVQVETIATITVSMLLVDNAV